MADKHTAPGGIAEAPARLTAVDLERLNRASPEELLAWAADFGERAAIMTSFQKTGCVMIDMAHRAGLGLRAVSYIHLTLPTVSSVDLSVRDAPLKTKQTL